MHIHLTPLLITRFWAKVEKTDTCWLWQGTRPRGYGHLRIGGGKVIGAHRLSWIITYGMIPRGMFVCHHCDVRNCVRPAHLFLGTCKENMVDASRKGRTSRGDSHHTRTHPERVRRGVSHYKVKLNNEQVLTIRRLRTQGRTLASLAKEFGVTNGNIYFITSGKTWSHLPMQ